MRKLTDHRVNGLNEALDILVTDTAGSGGANHRYEIHRLFSEANPDPVKDGPGEAHAHGPTVILFQNGPVKEAGFNGITNEALLAIVADRLRGFQSGKFACRDNAVALTKLEEAMMWLHKRTRERMARGVEGTHTP